MRALDQRIQSMKRGYFGFILGLFLLGSLSNFATGYSEFDIHAFTSPPVFHPVQ